MAGLDQWIGRWTDAERPLRSLPRWAAGTVLLLAVAALAWSAVAHRQMNNGGGARAVVDATSGIGDLGLYSNIAERVTRGEAYYSAALAEQRVHGYPARPFVTVRTPIMAWGARLWGQGGWQVIAYVLLLANVLVWTRALADRTLRAERIAAAVVIFACGLGVFNARYIVLHDLFAGLLVSLALGLYRPNRLWPSWIAAATGLAIRELALPFVLLWAVLALSQQRWRELFGVAAMLALFMIGMAFHAGAVADARLPGDRASLGWIEMIGPAMFLASVAELTPLLALPPTVSGPLALLPLIGWLGLGGHKGLFASLWFGLRARRVDIRAVGKLLLGAPGASRLRRRARTRSAGTHRPPQGGARQTLTIGGQASRGLALGGQHS